MLLTMIHANPARLVAHQLASENARDAVRLARLLRGPGADSRADQLVRAAFSVSSNIAEACGRGTVREFRQFLVYARGSAQELVSQLRIAKGIETTRTAMFTRVEIRTVLVLKMLRALYDHPPADREP
jgi:four helix bundle protein